MTPEQDFIDFLATHGLWVDELVHGRIARAHAGHRANDKNDGSYCFFGSNGWCQNHKLGTGTVYWSYFQERKELAQAAFSLANLFNDKSIMADLAKFAKAAERAKKILTLSLPIPWNHPYLAKKGFGIEVAPLITDLYQGAWTKNGKTQRNCLLMPLRDTAGNLWSLQSINENGDKDLLFQGKKTGNFFLIGQLTSPMGLVEGLATGLSVAQIFNTNVAVCVDCGNLAKVACQLRGYGIQEITVYADNDHAGIAGAQAVKQAISAKIVLPNQSGFDWNDYHQERKLNGV